MASLLGSLRVRLTAETEDFRRGLSEAQKNLASMQKQMNKFRNNTLANVASFGALAAVLRSSLNVANQYDNAQRQLAATAKLTGVELGFLESTSKAAQDQFKLSAISANAFTIEMTKLAGKAGDVGKASAGLAAFLDIGAARGLSADQTLKAVQQSILGIDEGTDKLFSKNPSVLYQEFAAKIGTTAGKLTDQQKAQALLDAAMQDGSKVRGEYQKWLESSQGQQFLLSQGIEQTQATLGKALQPALVAIIPIVAKMADGVQKAIQGWQMLGATLGMIPGLWRAAKMALGGNMEGARKELAATKEAWHEVITDIQDSSKATVPASFDPSKLNGMGTTGTVQQAGKKAAKQFFDALESEWENLRHSVALEGLSITGTDSQRLAAEEQHALNLLAIEEQQARVRHQLKELTDAELAASLKEIAIKREIATATRTQMDAARQANTVLLASFERQDIILSDALEKERIVNQVALSRLDSEGSISDRLALQLDLVERTYQLQRNALLEDVRLSDTQLQNELTKLDLAKEREQLQLRMNAEAEKERQGSERRQGMRDSMLGTATNIAASFISGQKMSGAQIGSDIGATVGQMIPIPFASSITSAIGGLIGGLFDGKKEEATHPVVKGLDAIERAQKETIQAIAAQTDALLKPEHRLMNLPSSFNVPSYAPPGVGAGTMARAGNTSVTYGDTNITVQVSVASGKPEELERAVTDALGKVLYDQRRNQAW